MRERERERQRERERERERDTEKPLPLSELKNEIDELYINLKLISQRLQ